MSDLKTPCEDCPWRKSNQGKRHPLGFFTKANLQRLWNQVRGGGKPQSCHKTDPSHPDHIATGTKPGAQPRECPGSVIIVLRELINLAGPKRMISPEGCDSYFTRRKKGLTKQGILYWALTRMTMGGVPFLGGGKLPDVDVEDQEIGLPDHLLA